MNHSELQTRALQKNLDEARRSAETDHLTGLPNRRAFESVFEAELALARKQDRVSVGLKVSGIGMHTAGMGSRKTLAGEVGMVVTPAPKVSLGVSLSHFTSPGFQPVTLALGVAVRPEAKVHLSGQLDYPVGGRAEVRLGLHYQLRKQLGFSAGVNPALRRVHFGTNVLAGRYGFLYGVATHPYVGIAHHTTFIYQLHD